MRNHMTFLLVVILCIYLAVHFGVARYVVGPSFEQLEIDEAQRNMNRVIATLEREVQLLDRLGFDWSAWDEAYQYMVDRNEAFANANLIDETFHHNKLNLLYFIDPQGVVVWGRYEDMNKNRIESSVFPQGNWPNNHRLLKHRDIRTGIKGLILDGDRILMVSSRQIIRSNNSGPSRGVLVMGRILDRAALLQMSEQTHVAIEAWSLKGDAYPNKDDLIKALDQKPIFVKHSSERELHVFAIHNTITGKSGVLIRIAMTRDITERAEQAMRLGLISVLLTGIVLVVGMFIWLRNSVVSPLVSLADEVHKNQKSVDPTLKLLHRKDEIGELARAYAKILHELSEEQTHLAERSYVIGKNEVISGLMHNIRNGLHPVAAFSDLMLQDTREAPLEDLEAAIRELEAGNADAQRQKALEEFLVFSLKEMIRMHYDFRESLGKVIDQTKKVIQIASTYKQNMEEPTQEALTFARLIADARKALPPWESERTTIRLHPSVPGAPEFHSNRIQLQKVLTNLLLFAPIPAPESGDIEIRLGIADSPETHVCLEIIHSRISLTPDELERMFERGYTGFRSVPDQGLHWCANTVNALGGRIKVQQAYGSTVFQLTIPRNQGN